MAMMTQSLEAEIRAYAAAEAAFAQASGLGGVPAPAKLFVGGIAASTTTEALRSHFSKYGRIIDAVVMQKNGRPRGFGFVTFGAPAAAVMAFAEPQWLDGRHVDVKQAVPGDRPVTFFHGKARSSNKLFVGGLPQDVGTEELKIYFGRYGAVADAVVMVDRRTNRSRGFGFVRFASGSKGNAASEAVLNDFASHRLGGKWVEVKRATPAALLSAAQDSSPSSSYGGKSPSSASTDVPSTPPVPTSPCGCGVLGGTGICSGRSSLMALDEMDCSGTYQNADLRYLLPGLAGWPSQGVDGATPTLAALGTAARAQPHQARGRRGNRRRKRGSGSNEAAPGSGGAAAGQSPECEDGDEDWCEGEEETEASSPTRSEGSGKGCLRGQTPATISVADAFRRHMATGVAAAGRVGQGGVMLPHASTQQHMPVPPGPLRPRNGFGALSAGVIGDNRAGKAKSFVARAGWTENDPAVANLTATSGLLGSHGGLEGVPMKVVCLDADRPLPRVARDAFGPKEDFGFARGGFFSLEVGTSLSSRRTTCA